MSPSVHCFTTYIVNISPCTTKNGRTVQVWGKLPHHQQTRSSSSMDGHSDNRNLKSGVCWYATRTWNTPLLYFSISLKDFQKIAKQEYCFSPCWEELWEDSQLPSIAADEVTPLCLLLNLELTSYQQEPARPLDQKQNRDETR